MKTGRPPMTSRSEDLAFMAATGETPAGAAERLNISLTALEKWCDRHDRSAWARLVANAQHRGRGFRLGRLIA